MRTGLASLALLVAIACDAGAPAGDAPASEARPAPTPGPETTQRDSVPLPAARPEGAGLTQAFYPRPIQSSHPAP